MEPGDKGKGTSYTGMGADQPSPPREVYPAATAVPSNQQPQSAMGVPVIEVPIVLCEASTIAERIRDRRVKPRVHEYMVKGWNLTMKNFCELVAMILIVTILNILRSMIPYSGVDPNASYMGASGVLVGALISTLFDAFISIPLYAGIVKAILNGMRRNDNVQFSDFFWAYRCDYFWKLLGLNLVAAFFIWLGFLVFIIPGIIFAFMCTWIIPLHQESNLGIWGSIAASAHLSCRYCCSTLCFWLYAFFVCILGLCFFFVGIYLAIPVTVCASLYFYRDIVGVNGLPLYVDEVPRQQQQYADRV